MTAEAVHRGSADDAGFRLLAEHLPDIIILAFDDRLDIWAATGTALRARGWTAGQFLGRKVPEVGRPADAAITEASCRAALRGEVSRFETTGNLDPSRLWAMQFLPLPAERGAIVGGMVLARDITRQRRAERQLEASRHQLAEAQRIAQIGSWEWDVVANEVTVSDELCRLIGLPLGSRWTMEEGVARLIPKMEIEQVERLVERMRTDPSPYAHEHRMVASDGSIRTFLARGEGMVDEDGRVVRFIGTDQDITERRQAEAERRRLLHRVYEAQEGQDRRLAADLHDGHVQSLAAIGFKLEQARLRLGASGSPEVDELLWQVTKDLSAEVTSLRRTIGRLRPLVLVEDGLEAALFRAAQQALANVVDHAAATYALVAIECSQNGVVLRVSDDGCGFGGGTVVEAKLPLTDPTEGWGA